MTKRESDGKFAIQCPVKRAKTKARKWWKDHRDMIIGITFTVALVFGCITLCVWMFGEKVTYPEDCTTYDIPAKNTSDWNYYYMQLYSLPYGCYHEYIANHSTCKVCKTIEVKSRYTLPESVGLVWTAFVSIVGNFVGWITSHPVI